MTRIIDMKTLRELLGVDPADLVEEVGQAPDVASDVGEGLDFQTAETGDGRLVELVQQAPYFDLVEEINEVLDTGRIDRWQRDSGVFRLQDLRESAMVSGTVESTPQGNWIIDARGEDYSVVRFSADRGEMVLVGYGGGLSCFRTTREETDDELAMRLREYRPGEDVELEVPGPDELLADVSPANWLIERALVLHSSPALHDRVASVGLAARLGAGTTESPKLVFEELVSGQRRSPTARALDWVRNLDTDVVDVVERQTLELADALESDLADLEGMVAEGGETARTAVRGVLYRRDDLESLAWVLTAADRVAAVRPALEKVDREAASHLSAVDMAREDDDDLLSAVSWQEPNAWWG